MKSLFSSLANWTPGNRFWLVTAAVIVLAVFVAILILCIKTAARRMKSVPQDAYLDMDGIEFENYCADLLAANGFTEIELTPATADFGVDIFAEKDGITYAFQCKRYDHPVGTRAVQEIYGGRDFYHCMIGVVLTNQEFTSGAYKMAEAFNILLWGREKLEEMEGIGRE